MVPAVVYYHTTAVWKQGQDWNPQVNAQKVAQILLKLNDIGYFGSFNILV